MQKQKNVG